MYSLARETESSYLITQMGMVLVYCTSVSRIYTVVPLSRQAWSHSPFQTIPPLPPLQHLPQPVLLKWHGRGSAQYALRVERAVRAGAWRVRGLTRTEEASQVVPVGNSSADQMPVSHRTCALHVDLHVSRVCVHCSSHFFLCFFCCLFEPSNFLPLHALPQVPLALWHSIWHS